MKETGAIRDFAKDPNMYWQFLLRRIFFTGICLFCTEIYAVNVLRLFSRQRMLLLCAVKQHITGYKGMTSWLYRYDTVF